MAALFPGTTLRRWVVLRASAQTPPAHPEELELSLLVDGQPRPGAVLWASFEEHEHLLTALLPQELAPGQEVHLRVLAGFGPPQERLYARRTIWLGTCAPPTQVVRVSGQPLLLPAPQAQLVAQGQAQQWVYQGDTPEGWLVGLEGVALEGCVCTQSVQAGAQVLFESAVQERVVDGEQEYFRAGLLPQDTAALPPGFYAWFIKIERDQQLVRQVRTQLMVFRGKI